MKKAVMAVSLILTLVIALQVTAVNRLGDRIGQRYGHTPFAFERNKVAAIVIGALLLVGGLSSYRSPRLSLVAFIAAVAAGVIGRAFLWAFLSGMLAALLQLPEVSGLQVFDQNLEEIFVSYAE